MCGGERSATTDAQTHEAVLKVHLTEMLKRLDQAAGIAKAATTCAETGNIDKAIEIALDVEQLTFEVSNLLNSASLHRIHET